MIIIITTILLTTRCCASVLDGYTQTLFEIKMLIDFEHTWRLKIHGNYLKAQVLNMF